MWRMIDTDPPPVPPDTFSAIVDPSFHDEVTGRTWNIALLFTLRNGRADVSSVTLEDADGDGITAEFIRRIPWGEIISDLRKGLADDFRLRASSLDQLAAAYPEVSQFLTPVAANIRMHAGAAEQVGGRGRPRIAADKLAAVAAIYRHATLLGENPVQKVAATLGLTRTTASKWIRRAREGGYLGASIPGKAGEA